MENQQKPLHYRGYLYSCRLITTLKTGESDFLSGGVFWTQIYG
jgi:hypothetical protein